MLTREESRAVIVSELADMGRGLAAGSQHYHAARAALKLGKLGNAAMWIRAWHEEQAALLADIPADY